MQLPIALFKYFAKVVGKNLYSEKSYFSVSEILRLCVFINLYSSPIPANIQGQVGWGSEQLDLLEDILGHCWGLD